MHQFEVFLTGSTGIMAFQDVGKATEAPGGGLTSQHDAQIVQITLFLNLIGMKLISIYWKCDSCLIL